MPRFSIIVIHYQGTIPHGIFCRGIASLRAQTFKDFEILCYHDGPLLDPKVRMPIEVICTPTRFNDWGHSLRDLGIHAAAGDYLLFFNADNILYPDALAELDRESRREPRMNVNGPNGPVALDPDTILVFPVKMFGMIRGGAGQTRIVTDDFFMILTGNPPVWGNIDAMQFVMKRSLWLAEGGWHDKSEKSDGHLYEKFAKKYLYRGVGPVLGEHH